MPARSNPFQKLILRIHEQAAPAGIPVTVDESTFSAEPSSGSPRETDVRVVMQTSSGSQRVAIECRAHGRRQEVGWVDALIGKYIDLDFDKVIAVSSSGFSSTALAKAAKFGIECRTLETALDTDWPAEFIKLGVVTVEHQLTDLRFGIKCAPPLLGRNEVDDVVIASDGSKHGYAAVMKWLEHEALQYFLAERSKTFAVLADFDNKYTIEIVRRPNEVYLIHEETRHVVVRFTFSCTVVTTKTKHSVRHQRYPGALISTPDVSVLGQDLTIIQGTDRAAHVFKGAELESVKLTPFESAKDEGSGP